MQNNAEIKCFTHIYKRLFFLAEENSDKVIFWPSGIQFYGFYLFLRKKYNFNVDQKYIQYFNEIIDLEIKFIQIYFFFFYILNLIKKIKDGYIFGTFIIFSS